MTNGSFKSNSFINKIKSKLNPFNLVIKSSSTSAKGQVPYHSQLSKLQAKQKKIIDNILQNKDSAKLEESSKRINKFTNPYQNRNLQDMYYSQLRDLFKPTKPSKALQKMLDSSSKFKKEPRKVKHLNLKLDKKKSKTKTTEKKLNYLKSFKTNQNPPDKYNVENESFEINKFNEPGENNRVVRRVDLFGEDLTLSIDLDSIGEIWNSFAGSSIGISNIEDDSNE